jgi:hypothetical protein
MGGTMKIIKLIGGLTILFALTGCVEPYSPVGKGNELPPEIVETTPVDGTDDVSAETTVSIKFSKSLMDTSVHTSSIIMLENEISLNYAVNLSEDGKSVEIIPESELNEGSLYSVEVYRIITDEAGLPLKTDGTDSPYRFSFSIKTVAPVIVKTVPEAGEEAKASELEEITVEFSKKMDASTINESTVLLTDVDCEVSYDEETMTAVLTPGIKLTHSTSYNIIITDAVKDIAGTSIGADTIINFTTAEE